MLAENLQSWATVTHKGQVTIPKQIRERLGVPDGGKIRFRLRYDGLIVIERPTQAKQIIGSLSRYANTDMPVNAYDAKEKMERDRAKKLGY
ncbi:MAG: AbrB/MazE/SpoVT family DNA-binding domain-containing protein [Negativicutes bacterium]